MTEDQHTQQDPTQQYPQPDYPEQDQRDHHPGSESAMRPEPDYGPDTYTSHRTFKTNIYAMFWLCKAAIPHMPEGGSIINVGSIQAYQPSPTLLPYSATKGAIVTFTKGLAQEVVSYGLRANTVAPGPVWTPI